ncbi:hypothetical protein GCM10023198_60090 [Promicromonospora umidemergens]|uniref:Uncharacterized protein n=1 Tax=Promicromonospora umidemergens TaxID=629679 RepID=A0ABP8YHB8_9MICO
MVSTVEVPPLMAGAAHPQVEFTIDGVAHRVDCCDVGDAALEQAAAVRDAES